MADTTKSLPSGVRLTSNFSYAIGIITIVGALAIGIPTLLQRGDPLPLLVNAVVAADVLVAGFLLRRQRRVGGILLGLAWAVPSVLNLALGQAPGGGSLLLLAASILALVNWKQLH